MEKEKGTPNNVAYFLSKIFLNVIYTNSIMKTSDCTVRSLTLTVCPSLSLLKDQSKVFLLCVCLSFCLSAVLLLSRFICLSVCLSVCRSVGLSVCRSVGLSVS